MIEVTVDFANFKWSPICACDLTASCIDIIIASVSAEYSRLEVLGMITIGLVVKADDHFLDPTVQNVLIFTALQNRPAHR